MEADRGAYTLVELMVAVTLLAVAVASVTVNMGGLSDRATLAAAADQLGACYRLVVGKAATTGRPHALVLRPQSCGMKRPVPFEESWRWDYTELVELVPRVAIQSVGREPVNAAPEAGATWGVPIAPGDWTFRMHVGLQLVSGAQATAEVSGPRGRARLLRLEDGVE